MAAPDQIGWTLRSAGAHSLVSQKTASLLGTCVLDRSSQPESLITATGDPAHRLTNKSDLGTEVQASCQSAND
jgi:hypothetical protein